MSNPTTMNEISERVFFCTKNGAHKFWRVSVCGETQTVCWGRIGTLGQTLTRTFADFETAKAASNALIAQKTAKGYTEVSVEEANAVVPVPVPRSQRVRAASQMRLTFDEEIIPDSDAFSASCPPASPAPAAPLSLF